MISVCCFLKKTAHQDQGTHPGTTVITVPANAFDPEPHWAACHPHLGSEAAASEPTGCGGHRVVICYGSEGPELFLNSGPLQTLGEGVEGQAS